MTDSNYSVSDGVLSIAGNRISTEFAVVDAIPILESIVIRLEVPPESFCNRNVKCYGSNGELAWTIQESPYGGSKTKCYVNLLLNESGELVARTFDGVEYRINTEDGTVTAIEFRRF